MFRPAPPRLRRAECQRAGACVCQRASGQLNSREFVFGLVSEMVKELHNQDKGMVFSGSPREEKEAEILMALLEEMYGRDGIAIIRIDLSEEESLKRNSHRRICKANRHPIPNFPEFEDITACPEDGSEIVTRVLDDPETIKIRYEVYKKQTEEVFDFFKKKGYTFKEINGEQPIIDVHRDILNMIHDSEK